MKLTSTEAWAYLALSHAELYADRSAWDALQEDVVARLEALR